MARENPFSWNIVATVINTPTLLTQARLEQGMTQVDLAAKLRQPLSLISKTEGAERRIDVIEVVDICRAVGLSPSEVITLLE